MTHRINIALLIITLSLIISSCKKDEKDPLVIPAEYDGTNFMTHAATAQALRAQLRSLTVYMQTARTAGVSVTSSELNALYAAGNPSVQSITQSNFRNRMSFFFQELAKGSGGTFDPRQPVSGEGGVFGGYLFDENGAEMEQLAEKGLFGAAMYFEVSQNIFNNNIDLAKLDAALSLYGAHPSFPNSNNAAKHENPDGFSATYAARRDQNTGNGLYRRIQQNFIKAQAAIKAGNDYNKERDEALNEILLLWEQALFATVANYCYSAIDKLSLTNPSDNDLGSALHALGEAVGFSAGMVGVPRKKISDQAIEEILSLLKYPNDNNINMHDFVKNPVAGVADLILITQKIQNIYGFSQADMEGFRKNWVNEQQR